MTNLMSQDQDKTKTSCHKIKKKSRPSAIRRGKYLMSQDHDKTKTKCNRLNVRLGHKTKTRSHINYFPIPNSGLTIMREKPSSLDETL